MREGGSGGGGAGGRDGEASEGVVPGSTNQRQDAIDRHVAPGWCNEFRRGWKGGRALPLPPRRRWRRRRRWGWWWRWRRRRRRWIEREKGSSHPGGRRKSGRKRERGRGARGVADARVLHTPLHLLVNRINQRHHGLSPIPLRLRAPSLTFSPTPLPPPRLSLSLRSFLASSPSLFSFTTTSARDSIAIYNAHRHSLTVPSQLARRGARDRKTRRRKRRIRKSGWPGGLEGGG